MRRRIVRQGGSYYIALPPHLVTRKMLENGVEVEPVLFDLKRGELLIKIKEASEEGCI